MQKAKIILVLILCSLFIGLSGISVLAQDNGDKADENKDNIEAEKKAIEADKKAISETMKNYKNYVLKEDAKNLLTLYLHLILIKRQHLQ